MWLTLLAVRNSVAVLMASLAIVVLGFTSLSRMPIDLFPNINLPSITIGTEYKGANVQDIEKTVTYPIEKAVSAVANVRHVESKSRQGISAVQVWFNYDADMNAAQTEVSQRILQILNSLPSGIKTPFIIRSDLSNIPVCLITVSGGGLDEKQLYDVAFNTIEPQIERLNGVAAANVDGGKIRQIAVNLNRDLLYAKGLSGPRRRAGGQRRELPHALGRHPGRQHRLQALHQQPVPARQAHGGHRRPEGRRASRSTSATSAT